MTVLSLGVLLWMAAHLFKRILPAQRAALGRTGRIVVATAILVSIALMIIGYRAAEEVALYALPLWSWQLNNLLMLAALFMLDVGRAKGAVRTKVRHPMLLGVAIWSTAHLLVNGDLASLVLFGGLGLWALVEMVVISRVEGDWHPPATGSILNDGKIAILAMALYGLIAAIHYRLGYPVIVLF